MSFRQFSQQSKLRLKNTMSPRPTSQSPVTYATRSYWLVEWHHATAINNSKLFIYYLKMTKEIVGEKWQYNLHRSASPLIIIIYTQAILMDQKQTQSLNSPQTFIHNLLFPKKSWTPEEDQLLLAAVSRWGANKWTQISRHIPGRLGKQCRERWYNHLSPAINRADWTAEEEWLLFLAHTVLGGKWARLTRLLPGRTDNCIKNHWNSSMRKKIGPLSDKLQQLCGKDTNDQRSKAIELLKTNSPRFSQELNFQKTISPTDTAWERESPKLQLSRRLSCESVSFSNILKRMDQNDPGLQRQESYQYKGWCGLSSGKKRKGKTSEIVSFDQISEDQKAQTSKTLEEKENRLSPIEQFLEEQEIPLPLPLRRLSSIDYSPILISRDSSTPCND